MAAILPVQAGNEGPEVPLLPVFTGGEVFPVLPMQANLVKEGGEEPRPEEGDDGWGAASSSSALHIVIIVLTHAAVIGIGAPCAREAHARPVLCGAVMPRVVVALLIGVALLYAGMFRVSEVKALCLAGGISAVTLIAVQASALLSRLLGDEASLATLLQPVGAALSLLTMIGAWLFTFQEEAMRKIFGLTTGAT